jgi:hypothetical protein
VKLNRLCGLVAAQFGGKAQGAVDAGCDACGEDPGSVDDNTFIDRDRAKKGAG